MENKKLQAINLMVEDLHTSHTNIRIQSLELGCDIELEEVKIALLEYLYEMKSKISVDSKV